MGLLPGRYTPHVQEAITRWGSRISFGEAQEELEMMWGIKISATGVRDVTLRHGQAADELMQEKVRILEVNAPASQAKPKQLVMSADGAMVQVTNGEWREVKLVAFGEFEAQWNAKKRAITTKTKDVSYFSRVTTAEKFGQMALYEWQQRGGDNAQRVVAVNDGALWIQSFIDYHCPNAIRVIDFAHAQSYVAAIGKAVYGAETDTFKNWYSRMSHQLGHLPPQRTLAELCFLQQQHPDHPQADVIEQSLFYLNSRQEMIDYPHFRQMQIPIGSGIVESGHKVVMQRRMKQAGMRWAEANLNPMLTLRMALCNKRWVSSWHSIATYCRQTNRQKRIKQAKVIKSDTTQTLVTELDCQRLTKLAHHIRLKTKSRQPWRGHRWVFPHRSPLPHRN